MIYAKYQSAKINWRTSATLVINALDEDKKILRKSNQIEWKIQIPKQNKGDILSLH